MLSSINDVFKLLLFFFIEFLAYGKLAILLYYYTTNRNNCVVQRVQVRKGKDYDWLLK